MTARLINSRITWIALPIVMTCVALGAWTQARQPVSDHSLHHLVDQLRENAADDSALSLNSLVSEDDLNLAVAKVIFDKQFEGPVSRLLRNFSPSIFYLQNVVAAQASLDPANASAMLEAATNVIDGYLDKYTTATFQGEGPQIDYAAASLTCGAVFAAQQGEFDTALKRLKLLTRLYERCFDKIIGTNSGELYLFYNAFSNVALYATAPEDLKRLRTALNETQPLLDPSHEALFNPYMNVITPSRHMLSENEWAIALTVSAAMLTRYTPGEIGDISVPNIGFINGELPIPWTRNPYLLHSNLQELTNRVGKWRKLIPPIYFRNLSKKEIPMAATLLLKQPGLRQYFYLQRRSRATQRTIVEAAILTRLYRAEHGSLPATLDDLTPYGYTQPEAVVRENLEKILEEVRDISEIPGDTQPLGPLEIVHITMTPGDIKSWLNLPDETRVTRLQQTANASTSTSSWQIVLGDKTGPQSHDPNFGAVDRTLLELEVRPDLQITSTTLTTSDGQIISQDQREKWRVYSDESDFEKQQRLLNPDKEAVTRPPQIRAIVELEAPTIMGKIRLKDEGSVITPAGNRSLLLPQPEWLGNIDVPRADANRR